MDYLKLFLDHLKIDKGSSPLTCSAYEQDLNQFLESLDSNSQSTLLKVNENDIQKFLKQLQKSAHRSTSVARKVSAIKQFYKFLVSENLIDEDPSLFIEAPVRTKRLPKALDTQNILKLLDAAEEGIPYPEQKEILNLRDQAMIYLLYASGLRVSELIGLKTSQVDTESGILRVIGKRNKERLVPFAPIAGEKILEYLASARPLLNPTSDVLFLGRRGEPLTRQAFWKTLKRIAELASIPVNLHPHMLRHTFATDLLKSGMNLRSLQMLLGHSDLQTTEIYTHVAPDTLAEVIKRYHPRGSK